jgi:DNA-binding SARP family transcriptional activator
VRVSESLSQVYTRTGQQALAVVHAQKALAAEPFRETAYQLLMRAHFTSGNRAEALRSYARCREALSEDLGVAPSAETEALYLEILRA